MQKQNNTNMSNNTNVQEQHEINQNKIKKS
jgi:hypothetical protein